MARKAKTRAGNSELEAAVEYFSARSHAAWRKNFHKNNPAEKSKPRMRERGGVMVDINQPWEKLHPKAQADNKVAARTAYAAVKKFPNDREAASNFVHEAWMKRNKGDANQPKELFKPYAKLPEIEKDKDRAHIDNMQRALAAIRKPALKKAKRAVAPATKLDARSAKKLQTAAKQLSKALGREVPVDVVLAASVEAMAALCKAMAAQAPAKRAKNR